MASASRGRQYSYLFYDLAGNAAPHIATLIKRYAGRGTWERLRMTSRTIFLRTLHHGLLRLPCDWIRDEAVTKASVYQPMDLRAFKNLCLVQLINMSHEDIVTTLETMDPKFLQCIAILNTSDESDSDLNLQRFSHLKQFHMYYPKACKRVICPPSVRLIVSNAIDQPTVDHQTNVKIFWRRGRLCK